MTSPICFLSVLFAYEIFTGGKLPYGDQLKRNINWHSISKIEYISALKYNPMIPLCLDGALHKAVRCDQRMRYDTFSEFIYDLAHPNDLFTKNGIPLIDKDPVKFCRSSAAFLCWEICYCCIYY